ncbi:hypothetical protein bcgnr5390_12430 [Bacillus luti]|nr:hypothetical protein BC2903_51110 [Bacillus cereus]
MENVKVTKKENNSYEVRWTSNNGNFLMTLDENINVEALTHRIDKPLQLATFCSGMTELYYPGLSQVILKIVKEYVKLEEHKAKINHVQKKKLPEIRALLTSETPAKIKKENPIKIVEPKPNTVITKETTKKEHLVIQERQKPDNPKQNIKKDKPIAPKQSPNITPKKPAITTIKRTPVIKTMVSYIKLNFLHDKPRNTPETKKLCDQCKALGKVETKNDNKENTTYLCPLCFNKKERTLSKKY